MLFDLVNNFSLPYSLLPPFLRFIRVETTSRRQDLDRVLGLVARIGKLVYAQPGEEIFNSTLKRKSLHFLKHDLIGTHYTWLKESEVNIFVGQPTRRAFNPFNGDQVLFIINFYGSLSDQSTIREGRKIEHDLINHLPIGQQSEISVFNWLRSREKMRSQ